MCSGADAPRQGSPRFADAPRGALVLRSSVIIRKNLNRLDYNCSTLNGLRYKHSVYFASNFNSSVIPRYGSKHLGDREGIDLNFVYSLISAAVILLVGCVRN
jgi:hypothetical protein